ncbi:MAG TPA: LacI family DNA-binding transcriptional regulator [Candidatus Omnitrophota bacterium]|nr:LacI family DNA-binding transcriptional regulator [Candidatus Omnitrophota bacterium]
MMRQKKIGLLTSFTSEILKGDYFVRIMTGMIDAVRQSKYELKPIMVRDGEGNDLAWQMLETDPVQGMLFLTWTIHRVYLQKAKDMNIPTVVINDFTPGLQENIVYSDNRAGVEQSLQHLRKTGRKRIGMLQAPDDASVDSRERLRLWHELLDQYGLTADEAHYRKCDYYFEEDGYLKMMDIIHTHQSLPQAMLCFNDDIAIGAMRALKESWIMCPGQVGVIGYDGIVKGKLMEPSLTTVNQPLEQMGSEMVRILIDLMEGSVQPPVQKKFTPELIVRRSC